MAVGLAVSIYGANGNGFGSTQGTPMTFPTNMIMCRAIEPTVLQGVTCNSSIQLLPSGLQLNQPQYYSPKTVDQLEALINA
jgi:hypothetical protein